MKKSVRFQTSPEHTLYEWLREKGLDHYYIGFVQSELIDLTEIARLHLPDVDLYDELEITLPGHRRRLERAVRQLGKKQRTTVLPSIARRVDSQGAAGSVPNITSTFDAEFESPVAYGRWGKPRCLTDAKYDFLILDARLMSTTDPRDKVDLEFMVDSGSDVVTIRQEVLDTMDLELIGPIRSKGVHASRTKNLYRANLRVGKQILEIEVMGESYDSIGSRVLRHFRHYINGSRHVWLKGDYVDPEMSPKSSQMTSSQDSLTTSSCSSQEKLSEHSVPSPPDAELPILSQEHAQRSGQPEGQNDESSAPKISEQTERSSPDPDANMQHDFARNTNDGKSHTELAQNGVITSETPSNSVDFNFVTVTLAKEPDPKSDEVDRVTYETDDVIDIRPIINANRKRHASDNVGFEPMCGDADVTKIRRKNRKTIQDNLNSLRTIQTNKTECAESHVMEVENEAEVFQTVMGQRSVYYRSQTKQHKDVES